MYKISAVNDGSPLDSYMYLCTCTTGIVTGHVVIVCRRSGGSRISRRGVVIYCCARSACAFLEATPTFGQNHAHFRSFLRQSTSSFSPINLFLNKFLLKHSKVSHLSVLKAWVSIYPSVFSTKYNATYLSTRTCYGPQLCIITKPYFYSFQKINYVN